MAIQKSNVVAVVRRLEHLDTVLAATPELADVHFVCLSLDTFAACCEKGLSASTPSSFRIFRERHFVREGNTCALEWVKAMVTESYSLSPDEQIYLATHFTFIFSMVRFTIDLCTVLSEIFEPATVYLWRDPRQTILGDWAPGSGEGAICAELGSFLLERQGIAVRFIDRANEGPANSNAPRVFGIAEKLQPFKVFVPKPIRMSLWRFYGLLQSQRTSARSLLKNFDRVLFRSRILLSRAHRRFSKNPLILFWGSHVDAVYQAELAEDWKKRFGWHVMRIEFCGPEELTARGKTRSGVPPPLGANEQFVLDAFGRRNSRTNHFLEVGPSLRTQSLAAWISSFTDWLAHEGEYQFRAMFGLAEWLRDRTQAVIDALRAIKPDCVVSHSDGTVALAARQIGIPSVVVAHGGIFSPYHISMHGDVNVVAGKLQKAFCESIGQTSGKVLVDGWPHITLDKISTKKCRRDKIHSRVVTLLVTDLDYYFWSTTDFDLYLATCRRLKELALANAFRLIVKLHPRYGDADLYQRLFDADGSQIKIETEPSLETVLLATDVAIISGLSTSIIEAFAVKVPVLFFFYHAAAWQVEDPFCARLIEAFACPTDLESFVDRLSQLLDSPEERAKTVAVQTKLKAEFISTQGREASIRLAEICHDLMRPDQGFARDSRALDITKS